MENKKWIVGLVVLVLMVAGAIFGFSKFGSKQKNDNQQVQGVNTIAEYFSEDATVMYFYSDRCSWCIKQKDILAKLAPEGYRVKPMDVGLDQTLWETYKINGTPTFVAANGDRLEGYQTEDQLKPFLDAHK